MSAAVPANLRQVYDAFRDRMADAQLEFTRAKRLAGYCSRWGCYKRSTGYCCAVHAAYMADAQAKYRARKGTR